MLSYREARKKITSGFFTPVCLFYGEEEYLREELERALAAAFLGESSGHGRERLDGTALSLEEILQRLGGRSLFAERRLLVVENPPYLAPPREKKGAARKDDAAEEPPEAPAGRDNPAPELLERFIERESAGGIENIILFRAPAADRRKKLFKLLDRKGMVVECARLKRDELSRWIRNRVERAGKNIEAAALEQLLQGGDSGLTYLSRELDKYITYLGDDEPTITAAVVELLHAGGSEGNVFKLADALAEGKLTRALQLLQLLTGRREKPVPIFFMLVRHFRLLLSTVALREEGFPRAKIAAELKVPPFVAGRLDGQARLYRRETLEEIMLALQQIDAGIKTGRLEPGQALEITLGRIHHLQSGK